MCLYNSFIVWIRPYQVHAAHCGDLETPPLPLSSLVSFSVLVVTGPLSIDFYDLTPHTTTTSPQLCFRMHDSFTCAFIYTLLPPPPPNHPQHFIPSRASV